ncbi:AMP-binding protein, partial [Sandaracinobacter sp.]|uniref:AMP-binding protein n=1 Tax=Sandaracinobacter sp. TaxID=2487581 RepID=UPI0035B3D29E
MGWIGSGERRITTAELDEAARRAAGVIAGYGLSKGDGVALYLRNDLAYFEALFGAGMLGLFPVPVNWHYTPDEAGYLLRDSGVKLLLIHEDLLPPVRAAIPEGLPVVVVETPPHIRAAYGLQAATPDDGLPRWHELLAAAAPFAGEAEPAPSSIIYTSGTTGRPKGVKRAAFTDEEAAAVNAMLGWSYGYTEVLEGRR